MKLLDDIINELVDSGISLTSPLLKTKVLASRIKNDVLLNWVNLELSGYPNEIAVPEYRNFSAGVYADYLNGRWKISNQILPISVLPEKIRVRFENIFFNESIESLEQLQKNANSNAIMSSLSADEISLFQYHIQLAGNPNLQILSASKRVSSNVLTQILSQVRSQLLDFILQLESAFGEEVDIKTLQSKKTEIVTIMNQTINNSGDGNVISTGDHASLTANIQVIKKNKETLVEALRAKQVSETDIEALSNIIDTEEPESNNTFGVKVRGWFTKMISKSLDGSWQITAGAAGGILTEIIKKYYGM